MRRYKELLIWQRGIELTLLIYRLTEKFPENEKYGLVSQMRRSAVSVPSNIAEGAGRRTTKDYINFLSIAQGSLNELETQLIVVERLGILDKMKIVEPLSLLGDLTRMLTTYIAKAS